jgi:hypothetical protein
MPSVSPLLPSELNWDLWWIPNWFVKTGMQFLSGFLNPFLALGKTQLIYNVTSFPEFSNR